MDDGQFGQSSRFGVCELQRRLVALEKKLLPLASRMRMVARYPSSLPFREPIVDRGEEIAGFVALAVGEPQPRKRGSGTQLPSPGILHLR